MIHKTYLLQSYEPLNKIDVGFCPRFHGKERNYRADTHFHDSALRQISHGAKEDVRLAHKLRADRQKLKVKLSK